MKHRPKGLFPLSRIVRTEAPTLKLVGFWAENFQNLSQRWIEQGKYSDQSLPNVESSGLFNKQGTYPNQSLPNVESSGLLN